MSMGKLVYFKQKICGLGHNKAVTRSKQDALLKLKEKQAFCNKPLATSHLLQTKMWNGVTTVRYCYE